MAKNRSLLAALGVALTAGAVYAQTLGHGFVFDDGPEVVDNELVRSLGDLPQIFASSAWKGSGEENPIYRPLATASYAVNYAIGALSPFGYHLANVLLHATASLLVLALGIQLGMSLGSATLAGLLFALHPVHVEVVANVAGRKDSLAAIFAISALLAHVSARKRGGAGLVAAPLALAAAMFSKETGVTAIGLIAARDLLFGREEWRRSRARAVGLYAAYGVELGLYLIARWAAVGSLGVPLDHIPYNENPIAHAPALVRVPTAIAVLGRGIALLVAPIQLSPDYSHRAIRAVTSPADPWFLLGLAAIVGATALAFRARRTWPLGLFALLWYAVTILPGSNLFFPVGTIFGERLLYLPSVGFCLAVGAMASRLFVKSAWPVLRWAVAAALVTLSVKTITYASVWSDGLSLFSAGVRAQPDSSKLRQCLGGALMKRGRASEAVPEFQREIEILRGSPAPLSRARLELGVAFEQLGRLDDAARQYDEILREDPRYSDALWRLGDVRWAENRRAEAVSYWLQTVAADPRHARAMSDLGIAYFLNGDEAGAKSMWLRATRADPALASAWYRLGNAYAREGDLDRARPAWREFLRRAHGKFLQERAEVEAKLRR